MLTRTVTFEEVIAGDVIGKARLKVCEVQRVGASVTLLMKSGERFVRETRGNDDPIEVVVDDPTLGEGL